jgi:hypothetical protein
LWVPELQIRLDILYNDNVTGEDDKAIFPIPDNTVPTQPGHMEGIPFGIYQDGLQRKEQVKGMGLV